MKYKTMSVVIGLLLLSLLLSACNLPSRQSVQEQSPTPPLAIAPAHTPTPTPLCDNQFFPTTKGDAWEYSGTNSSLGAYTRSDTITISGGDAFTLESKLAGVSYTVNFTCTSGGLVAADPVQQYAGAILSSPDAPVDVKIGNMEGTTLPAKINPGDTWQQTADFEASSKDLNLNGRFVFDYTAIGYENVTVPFGTFNTLHVDATIRIEVTGLRILAGTYTLSTWMAPGVGIVKSEGTSHVPGVDFTDSMQLTRFTTMP